jgi:hypothetical protein
VRLVVVQNGGSGTGVSGIHPGECRRGNRVEPQPDRDDPIQIEPLSRMKEAPSRQRRGRGDRVLGLPRPHVNRLQHPRLRLYREPDGRTGSDVPPGRGVPTTIGSSTHRKEGKFLIGRVQKPPDYWHPFCGLRPPVVFDGARRGGIDDRLHGASDRLRDRRVVPSPGVPV